MTTSWKKGGCLAKQHSPLLGRDLIVTCVFFFYAAPISGSAVFPIFQKKQVHFPFVCSVIQSAFFLA
jgi:hypothetical protein